jgi:pyrimidine 5'-nucleotidase
MPMFIIQSMLIDLTTMATAAASDDTAPVLLLFDLDGTLYDQICGYVDSVHSNIFKFMAEKTGGKFDSIGSIEEAEIVWRPIFQKYNLTKRGLLGEGYEFDTVDYDKYIRQGADRFIKPDSELRVFLESLPCRRKVIFTNAPEVSANEILDLLGVADLFEAVLGTDFLQDEVCKPERAAFDRVLNHLKIAPADYHRVWFFEDSYKNLVAGKELGMKTVFVKSLSTMKEEGKETRDLSQFDAAIEGKVAMELKEQIPELWGQTPATA